MTKEYIINCAGDKVPIADAGFTSRCAIGNTDDYLKSFKDHANPEIVSLGEPAPISIVVPSYASKEQNFYPTLLSLCTQEYPVPAEILVFINEPENASESARAINERNENFIRSLGDARPGDLSPELLRTRELLLAALLKSKGTVTLRCVHQVMAAGISGVYRSATASSIARVRTFCDSIRPAGDRPARIKCIEEYLRQCMLFFCDDDVEIKDPQAFAKAYAYAMANDAVVFGRVSITRVDTAEKYRGILRDLMQVFFDLKYDHGLIFLTPRGIRFVDILKVGEVKVDQMFADQVFFASAARGKKQYLVDVSTSIGESDYPSNGNFLKKLRQYLEGEDNKAYDIFENVLKRYQEDKHQGQYNAADIERLIRVLKTRDTGKISSAVSELLK